MGIAITPRTATTAPFLSGAIGRCAEIRGSPQGTGNELSAETRPWRPWLHARAASDVQRDDDGAIPERARYNSALIDTNSLKKGQDYKDLPDVYVIFITENDVLKGNKPIYTIERTVSELEHKSFDDRSHIIYVNGKFRDNSEIGKLMHDFSCNSVSEMNNSVLKDRTAYFKEKQEGKTTMCRIMEELKEETTAENSRKIALMLISAGNNTLEQIAIVTGLPLSEVKKLAEQK